MHYLLFLLLSVIWGSNFILMKKALLCFEPASIAVLRVTGGLLPLLLIWLFRRERWPLGREYFLPLLLVASMGYAWPFAVQPFLIRQADSGFIGMMVCFVPLMTILVSIPLLGILPKTRQVVGVVIGLACSGVILMSGHEQHDMRWPAIVMAVSVPLFYAITNTYIRRRFVGVGAMPLTISSLAFSTVILSSVVMLPEQIPASASAMPEASVTVAADVSGTAEISGSVAAETSTDSARPDSTVPSILAVLALGVIGTGLGIFIFNKLLQERGPLFASMVTYLIPLVAVLWGAVDGEQIESIQLIAFAGALAAVALVQYPGLDTPTIAGAAEETSG